MKSPSSQRSFQYSRQTSSCWPTNHTQWWLTTIDERIPADEQENKDILGAIRRIRRVTLNLELWLQQIPGTTSEVWGTAKMHRDLKVLGLCYRTYTCMYTCVCILINYSKPKPMCAADSLVTLRNKDAALSSTKTNNPARTNRLESRLGEETRPRIRMGK